MKRVMNPMYDVIIIGGGAAGMLAAIVAAERGRSVLVLEPNDKLGRKLRITGKGRCNITNDCSVREVIAAVPTGGKFLQSAMYAFPPSSAIEFFEKLGVPLKTERGRRVFPVSDNANDVADALLRRLKQLKVEVRKTKATQILTENGAVSGVLAGQEIPCGAVIIATGGVSYTSTGSTGDGYAIATELGHTIIPPRGSLVPLESSDTFCAEMQGLALKNIAIKVGDGGKKPIYEDFGELLFTHFGISGPLTLSASAHMRDFGTKNYTVTVDLKPALNAEMLDKRLLRDFEKNKNREFQNALGELCHRLMIPVVVERSGIEPTKQVNSVTRDERQKLLQLLKNFDIRISAPRPVDEAVITSGGVETTEITPATMESKLVKNLFFAGEVINADAYTGGFNLQIAWATAFAAGSNA
ncbi:MAG: NAD(P)/FAD-dependent oxidoreductase [Oscillospiraceae bacterium]|jgi:predicted Rossmann fold flavoprotein|nr:NAD(P)/FAD-dependent oxidoreductase [Oscillospiraceae bacterium]